MQPEATHGLLDVAVDLSIRDAGLKPLRATVRSGEVAALLLERQVFDGHTVRRRIDRAILPAVPNLEGLLAVFEDF
jgi:hypothetical protein